MARQGFLAKAGGTCTDFLVVVVVGSKLRVISRKQTEVITFLPLGAVWQEPGPRPQCLPGYPCIGIDVEGGDGAIEARSRFIEPHFHVGTGIPFRSPIFNAIKAQSRQNAHSFLRGGAA